MGLREYNRKRDFSRTPEPAGEAVENREGNTYLIQKHAASRLHYDFRLELGSVLKSWAVPKGPSLDPREKRLAVHTEDHPLAYGDFEGTIPKGEYGGGTVMLWDTGTWEALGDPEKDYAKGKLKFRLDGKRLQGIWTLARMGGKAGEEDKNWLLIKHRDEEAVSEDEYRIVDDQTRSIVSERSLDEIAGDEGVTDGEKAGKKTRRSTLPDPAKLPGAKKGKPPKDITPQLATLSKSAPVGKDWIHEIKYDGYRILAIVDKSGIRLISRNGKDWTDRFPHIAGTLARLPVNDAVLDGEVVSLLPNGVSDFQTLQNAMKGLEKARPENIVYYLFDMPWCDGHDLRKTPLIERKKLLEARLKAVPGKQHTIRYSDHINGGGDEVYKHSCQMALEGVVSKRADSSYVQKRSDTWLKVKCVKRQEFVIGGYTDGTGARSGFGALLLGYYDDGKLLYAGKVGTGFSDKLLRELSDSLEEIEQDKSPFSDASKAEKQRGVHWVAPRLVAEVEFTQWTREGYLRHPSFKGLREDKVARDVIREEESGSATGEKEKRMNKKDKAPRTFSIKKKDQISIAGVRLTHPDKILYPGQGITKVAIARYYESIADRILPFLTDRPLTLVRCPQGRDKKCFYQKHLNESLPEGVRGLEIQEKTKSEQYIAIDGLQGLIALVQIGVLEIHPWGSSETNLEKPDMLTFDLDPDPEVDWQEVVDGARLLNERLADLGLRSFLKTSGGKGLHLVLPIQRRSTWDEAKAFTKAIAQDLSRQEPDRFTSNMSKAKRKGRIFIDYLRNGRGATSVAVYSTRARRGAPVSAPLFWDELSAETKPDMFTVENLQRRLASLNSDPWEDFSGMRQSITKAMKRKLGLE